LAFAKGTSENADYPQERVDIPSPPQEIKSGLRCHLTAQAPADRVD
jgi:hypothetical protein